MQMEVGDRHLGSVLSVMRAQKPARALHAGRGTWSCGVSRGNASQGVSGLLQGWSVTSGGIFTIKTASNSFTLLDRATLNASHCTLLYSYVFFYLDP